MQIKALLLSAVAVATVSAQTFEVNACSTCVFSSFPKAPGCSTLTAAQLTSLTANFANGTVNASGLAAAAADPALQGCICSWAATAFTPTGAASGCTSGATPTCNSTQIGQASAGITPLVPLFHCSNSTASTSGSSTSTGAAPAATTAGKSPANINVPYVAMIAALGLAAIVGL